MNNATAGHDFWYALDIAWPDAWVDSLVRSCLQGGLLLLALWAICRLAPRLPVGARHWLWWLACLKLLITLFWVSPVTVLIALPTWYAGPFRFAESAPSPHRAGLSPIEVGHGAAAGAIAGGGGRRHRSPRQAPSPEILRELRGGRTTADSRGYWRPLALLVLLWIAWLFGACWTLSRALMQLVAVHRIRGRSVPITDPGLIGESKRIAAEIHLATPPALLCSREIRAPLVTGIVRPAVILPEGLIAEFTPEELSMILAHELAHLRRRDLILSIVPLLAQTLFFFFPLVWRACNEWTVAREAACDAQALRITHGSPAAYGRMLLIVATRGTDGNTLTSLGLTSGSHTLAMRLRFMSQFAATPGWRWRSLRFAFGPLSLLCMVPWSLNPRGLAGAPSDSTSIMRGVREESKRRVVQSNPDASYTITDLSAVFRDLIFTSDDRKAWHLQPLYCNIDRDGRVLFMAEEIRAGAALARRGVFLWDGHRSVVKLQEFKFGRESVSESILRGALRSTHFLPDEPGAGGFALNAAGEWKAVIPGGENRLLLPGGRRPNVTAASASGAVIGEEDVIDGKEQSCQAFLFSKGSVRPLGSLAYAGALCEPFALNNQDAVVGQAMSRGGKIHAFLYTDRRIQDLNTLIPDESGWELSAACGINDAGQIVGIGTNYAGESSYFLLTPRE